MSIETKMNLSDETINALSDLIRINRDSEKGFNDAAKQVKDAELGSLFNSLAGGRGANADELRQFVKSNGQETLVEGSYLAAFHRAWMDIRAMLSGGTASAILAEAERGEDYIKQAYEDVLKRTAGSAVNDVLTRQYANVKAGHDQIRELRNAYQAR